MGEQVKTKPLDVEKSTVMGYLKNMLGIGDGMSGDFLQQYKILDKKDKAELRINWIRHYYKDGTFRLIKENE